MRRKVTLKKAIAVVKLSLLPIWCWPQPRNVSKLKMFFKKLFHCFCIIMCICLILPLGNAVKNNLNPVKPINLVQSSFMLSSVTHTTFNFIYHIINEHHIQKVVFEMEQFSESMKPYEEVLIQQYIDQIGIYHGGSIFLFYSIWLLTVLQTFVVKDTIFPTYAEYPFDVFYQPLQTIILWQQNITGLFVTGQICTNIFMGLLLWFATAKLELLKKELMKSTNIYEIYKCIKKHQELLEYAAEVALVARPFAFSSICCSTISLIATFLLFISNQPLVTILQFAVISVSCISEILMFSWPAEYLIQECRNIGHEAFNMIDNTDMTNFIDIWKCLQIIIMRSQKPIIISIPCFLPMLSLSYFTSYCSTTLSYFTTLRVMM